MRQRTGDEHRGSERSGNCTRQQRDVIQGKQEACCLGSSARHAGRSWCALLCVTCILEGRGERERVIVTFKVGVWRWAACFLQEQHEEIGQKEVLPFVYHYLCILLRVQKYTMDNQHLHERWKLYI